MTDLVRFDSPYGVVLVEVERPPTIGPQPAATPGARIHEATEQFDKALDGMLPAVENIMAKLRDAEFRPQEIVVAFGVTLGLEASAFVAKGSAGANFSVTVTWRPDP